MNSDTFASIGVYGFSKLEVVILSALVTEDPLLLIGKSGTGKTYLLNSISEALGLQHRHYNASLISFDDLVGFPYPDEGKGTVRFLETPATVWGAESVLIDEISRCKVEHQNRLFSLVHERRIQGIPLPRLRYRWAAMNPCTADQHPGDSYSGSEPLDQALADRFALIVPVGDWGDLTLEEQLKVADPRGEGLLSNDGGRLKAQVEHWRKQFEVDLCNCPRQPLHYARAATTALSDAGLRISPRRSRLLSRSLLGATIITGEMTENVSRTILGASIPHRAWGQEPLPEVIAAAHRVAWDSAQLTGTSKWVHDFHMERSLPRKLELLLQHCPGQDAGTLALTELLARESRERAAAFAFAIYPAALAGRLPIGAEAINDLGKVAGPIMAVDGDISWQESTRRTAAAPGSPGHPEMTRFARVLSALEGSRQQRARQFFSWCMVNNVFPPEPSETEATIQACVEVLKEAGLV